METVLFVTDRRTPFVAPEYATELRECVPADFRFEALPITATPSEERAALGRAAYVVGFPHFGREQLEAARHVKLIHLMSAGFEKIDVAAARLLGIPVANNGGANAWSVAEHAVMLMLSVLRQLPRQIENARAGRWREGLSSRDCFELARKTVGIVGFGNIGRRVARCLVGFDAKILYYDIVRSGDVERELGARYAELPELLAASDIVSVHAPFNEHTRGLIGAAEFARMKPTAYIVNTSRGGLLDEKALCEALVAGRIAGAGLDVLEQEPTPPDNLLLRLPNVIVTPHMAGGVRDTWLRRCESTVENVTRVASGLAPLWVVS